MKNFSNAVLFQLALLLASLPTLFAFDPIAHTVFPRGGQLGTEVKATIHGDRLNDPEEIIFYRPGITVSDLKFVNNKRIEGIFHIAADAPLGEHPFRVRTKQGVTYLRTFWVNPFPTVKEAGTFDEKRKKTNETNDTFDTPQAIKLNTVVHGIARKEDADYYRFQGKKGQQVTIEVFGMRLGRTMFDPYLAILDSNRFELATCDDTVLTKRDPYLSLTLPEDGDYTILVRESSYQGADAANYLLQLSESPRPTSVHPPVGKPGQKLELTFKGPAGENKQTVTLPNKLGSTPLFAEVNGRKAPSPNPILVTDLPIISESEPNDRFEIVEQKGAPIPLVCHGILEKEDDKDWFRFSAKKGQDIRIQVHARSLRSPLDPTIGVRNAKDKKNLGNADDEGNNPDSKFDFKAPDDGDYFLLVRDHLNRGGPDYTYVVEITPRSPSLSAELPYAQNNDSQKHRAIVIPRGNHLAVVPNVARQNTNNDVVLQHDKLPTGVTVKSEPAPRSPANFPILFSAAKDAPLGSTLTTFTIKDTKSGLTGPLHENIHHVEINNAGPFCSTYNERLAVAVIEEAPFHLEIVAPKVPLVRNGTMSLIVRAKRAKDYKEAIKVKLPWRPPGVGAPPEVTIPADKNEVTIPINANSEAPTRNWSLLVTGEAKTKMGNVRVSSPFVTLTVAEPFLNGSIDLATTEVGQDVTLVCELENLQPFDGQAQLTLSGLPHKVTAQPISIKASDKSVKIPLKVPADVKHGKNKNIFAQVLIMKNGHPVPHQIASGTTLVITPSLAKETAKK
ncbi:MAG: PPC domain-containing protein [Roseibacillus sp.]